jgi:hypothetical protein
MASIVAIATIAEGISHLYNDAVLGRDRSVAVKPPANKEISEPIAASQTMSPDPRKYSKVLSLLGQLVHHFILSCIKGKC